MAPGPAPPDDADGCDVIEEKSGDIYMGLFPPASHTDVLE